MAAGRGAIGSRRRRAGAVRAWVALVCALACGAAGASDSTGAAEVAAEGDAPVDCEQAVALVLDEHPTLRAARSGVLEAEAATALLAWLDRPEVRFRSDAGTRDDEIRVGVRLPLPRPGVSAARGAAVARVEVSAAEAEVLAAEVAAGVRLDYAAARYERARQAIRERRARHARAHLEYVQRLAAAGSVTALARASAVLREEEERHEAAEARSRAELAERAAARWTARPAVDPGSACATAPVVVVDDAVDAHPAVRMARAAADAAGGEATAARRSHWLWPSFFEVTWVREDGRRADGVLLQTGIELPLPGKESPAAAARESRRRFEADAVERRVRAEIEAARDRLRAAIDAAEELEAGRDSLAGAADLAVRGEAAGADRAEIWQLQRRIAEREQQLARARYDLEVRQIELRRVLGLR